MAIQKSTIVWDDQKHTAVHLGMSNHEGESDAAYLRKCVEFYEMNKGGTVQQLILERLAAIERTLKQGVAIASDGNSQVPDDFTDEIFDEALEQLE